MLETHLLTSWSSTQTSISLLFGEAEYYGVIKAAGIALGQQSLMGDLGMKGGREGLDRQQRRSGDLWTVGARQAPARTDPHALFSGASAIRIDRVEEGERSRQPSRPLH